MTKPGTFTSENQPKKRKGKHPRTKILEAMERQGETEEGFYDLLVSRAFNDVDDNFSFGELLKRFSPVYKQVAPPIEFEFPKTGLPHEQAASVMNAVAAGQIPPDIGATFVTAIKSMVDIEESTELKKRIEQLEDMLNVAAN